MIGAVWKFLAGGGWIAVVLAALVAFGYSELKRAETRGMLRERTAEFRAKVEAYQADSVARAQRQGEADAIIASLRAEQAGRQEDLARARNAAQRATERAEEALQRLRALAPADSSAQADLDVVVAAQDSTAQEAASCQLTLASCLAAQRAAFVELEATRRDLAHADSLLNAAPAAIDNATAAGGGGIGLREVVAWTVAAVAVVLAFVH